MLVCQWVICMHLLGRPIPPARARRIYRYLGRQANEDGGFLMHPDGASGMFHTTLALAALALLGFDDDDPLVDGGRRWLQRRGGAYAVPTWGRVWLAMLGCYPWSHVQPTLSSLWSLHTRAPFHPRRLYCHMRMIYLGLSLVQDEVFGDPGDPRRRRLSRWLFPAGDAPDRFTPFLGTIASSDLYEQAPRGLARALRTARAVERRLPRRIRARVRSNALEHLHYEIAQTDGVCLSPVNGMLFCLALRAHAQPEDALARTLAGVEYWVWEDDHDGMRIAGARSDIWDTSFTLQLLAEVTPTALPTQATTRARAWLRRAQLRHDPPEAHRYHRAPSRGGWGFADARHPWPVSDCTAEALEALLVTSDHVDPFAPADVAAAVRFILSRQNPDGGFGSYEASRGGDWLHPLNPSEMYGNCMVEMSYPECTASCIRGLALARQHLHHPDHASLEEETARAIRAGVARLRALQDANGGWAGVWGVHFTYGTFFAVRGLLAAGVHPTDPAVRAACEYLCQRQREDGAWREHHEGLRYGREVSLPARDLGHPTQTAWALLTLMAAAPVRFDRQIRAGLGWLRTHQHPDGSWPAPAATGVFFKTAVLDYALYNVVFPTWALARAERLGLGVR